MSGFVEAPTQTGGGQEPPKKLTGLGGSGSSGESPKYQFASPREQAIAVFGERHAYYLEQWAKNLKPAEIMPIDRSTQVAADQLGQYLIKEERWSIPNSSSVICPHYFNGLFSPTVEPAVKVELPADPLVEDLDRFYRDQRPNAKALTHILEQAYPSNDRRPESFNLKDRYGKLKKGHSISSN